MAGSKHWIFLVSLEMFCVGWDGGSVTMAQDTVTDTVRRIVTDIVTDSKVGQVGALGPIPELVFKVQQIYIKYDCAYQDPDGVCSTKSSPDCSDVTNSGVCVLNSCERQSEADRSQVADLLAQIARISYITCDLTRDELLRAANGTTTLHIQSWISVLASLLCVLVTNTR